MFVAVCPSILGWNVSSPVHVCLCVSQYPGLPCIQSCQCLSLSVPVSWATLYPVLSMFVSLCPSILGYPVSSPVNVCLCVSQYLASLSVYLANWLTSVRASHNLQGARQLWWNEKYPYSALKMIGIPVQTLAKIWIRQNLDTNRLYCIVKKRECMQDFKWQHVTFFSVYG